MTITLAVPGNPIIKIIKITTTTKDRTTTIIKIMVEITNLVSGTNGVNGQPAEKLAEAGGRVENENVTVILEVPTVMVKVTRIEFELKR